jgi:hypothetical protein
MSNRTHVHQLLHLHLMCLPDLNMGVWQQSVSASLVQLRLHACTELFGSRRFCATSCSHCNTKAGQGVTCLHSAGACSNSETGIGTATCPLKTNCHKTTRDCRSRQSATWEQNASTKRPKALRHALRSLLNCSPPASLLSWCPPVCPRAWRGQPRPPKPAAAPVFESKQRQRSCVSVT